MKKLLSLVLVMILSIAIAVPAFAAGDGLSKADLIAKIDANSTGIPSSYIGFAKDIVATMDEADAGNVNLGDVKAAVNKAQAQANAANINPTTLAEIAADLKAATNGVVTIEITNFEISGANVAANVKATVTGKTPIEKKVAATVTPTEEAVAEATDSVTKSSSNPIKATGMDMNFGGIAVLGLAFTAVLGFAVVATRKLASAE